MWVDHALYSGGKLLLDTRDPEAKKLVLSFQPGEYEIKKARKKRSLDANAYMWALCEEIAKAINSSSLEVYRKVIREVGVYREWDNIPTEAAPTLKTGWERQGLGWLFEVVDYGGKPGCKLCRAYYGSSVYNSKQMSRLIDSLAQDAEAIGLEVMSDRERSLLLEDWGKKNG